MDERCHAGNHNEQELHPERDVVLGLDEAVGEARVRELLRPIVEQVVRAGGDARRVALRGRGGVG